MTIGEKTLWVLVWMSGVIFWAWLLDLSLHSVTWIQLHPDPRDFDPGIVAKTAALVPIPLVLLSLVPPILFGTGRMEKAKWLALCVLLFAPVYTLIIAALYFT